jgi:N-acetylglucosamine kinase-like BadF-type ATPase
MRIIVESGSTKSDWVLLDSENKRTYTSTIGFNPYFHDESTICSNILENQILNASADKVEMIHFYGAGCSADDLCALVERALKKIFPNAFVYVGHDLDACAFSTYRGRPVIACILGTGSNSCYFDGEAVYEEVPALAYILGDEGSGSYFGKQLLSKYLYKQLPEHLQQDFKEFYKTDKDEIISKVYLEPHANVYIASFATFLSRHKNEPFITEMVYEGVKKFMETHVLCFKNAREVEVSFVGSISYHFEDMLKKAAFDLGLTLGQIVKKPVDGLVDYHLNYIYQRTGV